MNICTELPEAPRFSGFVEGSLTALGKHVETKAGICRFGLHDCFAYRILENEFKDLVEVFGSVVDLCGTKELHCPSTSPLSPSPDLVFTHSPPRSLWSNEDAWTTNYVLDEDLDAVIASLSEQSNSIARTKPNTNKRPRPASQSAGRAVVSISIHLSCYLLAHQGVIQAGAVPIETVIERARCLKKPRNVI